MPPDNPEREIGRLAGAIEALNENSTARWSEMRQDMGTLRKAIDHVHDCMEKKSATLTDLVVTQHKAWQERYDQLSGRVTVLENDKAKIQGGWWVATKVSAISLASSGGLLGIAKWMGFIR